MMEALSQRSNDDTPPKSVTSHTFWEFLPNKLIQKTYSNRGNQKGVVMLSFYTFVHTRAPSAPPLNPARQKLISCSSRNRRNTLAGSFAVATSRKSKTKPPFARQPVQHFRNALFVPPSTLFFDETKPPSLGPCWSSLNPS